MIALLGAERRRLTSLRGPWIAFGITLVLAGGLTAIYVAFGVPAFDVSGADLGQPLLGMIDNQFMAVLIGALVVTPDLRFGGRAHALLAAPRRGRQLAASLVTAFGAGVVTALAAAAVCFAVGVPMMAGQGVDLGSAFADPVFWGRLATAVAASGLLTVSGAALGLLLHSLTATILVLVGMLTVEYFIVVLSTLPWFAAAVEWSWLHASVALDVGPGHADATTAFWAGGLALLGWVAVFTAGAAARAFRQDAA